MKPRDPKDIEGNVYSTHELLDQFADATNPLEPSKDSQAGMLAAASGYRDNGFANSIARINSEDSEENRAHRNGKNAQNLAFNAARWRNIDLIKLGGLGFGFEMIMNGFSHIGNSLGKKIDNAKQNMVVDDQKDIACAANGRTFRTQSELEQYGLRHGFDKVRCGVLTQEDIQIVDGQLVNKQQYEELLKLQETLATVQHYAEQVETGQLDPRDLPDDIVDMLVETREEMASQELAATGSLEYAEPSPVQAKFQDVFTVVPALTPELKP